MPEAVHPQAEAESVPDRIERYRQDVQRLVQQGAEHERYEFKRECSIARDDSRSRLDFVKLVQGLSNAHLQEERFIVIGADQAQRRFVPVNNPAEFDSANVDQVLGKYLEPPPRYEAFNSLKTDDGLAFVLIVVAASQPRPIVAKTDAQDKDNKFLIRKGEIWVKERTALRIATRQDLEAMYEVRIEAEAESRARARFQHLRSELEALQRLGPASGPLLPTSDLVFDQKENFRLYVRQLIATLDFARFQMLVELLRDLLVEGWHELDAYSQGAPGNIVEFSRQVKTYKTNKFLPALHQLVELGLLLIKHDIEGPWFGRVCDLLFEVFGSASRLSRLSALHPVGAAIDTLHFDAYVGQAMPALEALVGGRVLAIYAIKRERYHFLVPLLKKYVRAFAGPQDDIGSPREHVRPFSFWPIAVPFKVPEGLIQFCWQRRVQPAWAEYLGNQETFEQYACQYEFVVELNSYVAVGHAGDKPKAWIQTYMPRADFGYTAQLWRYPLDHVVPLAEKLWAALQRGKDDFLIVHVTVEKAPFDVLLSNATEQDAKLFLGGFLYYLQEEQKRWFFAQIPPVFPRLDWGEKLAPLVQQFASHKKDQKAP